MKNIRLIQTLLTGITGVILSGFVVLFVMSLVLFASFIFGVLTLILIVQYFIYSPYYGDKHETL